VRVRLHRARLSVRKEIGRSISGAARKVKTTKRRRRGQADGPNHRLAACRELFANLSEYLDGRVEPRTCAEMSAHIDAWPSCIAFLHDLRTAIDRCRSFEVRCDPAVIERLRARLTREYLDLMAVPAGKSAL